ncbi:unnamed protein product, partial [Ixodes pacificus]
KPFGKGPTRIFRGHRPHPRRPRTPREKGHALHGKAVRAVVTMPGQSASLPVLLVILSANGSLLLRNLWNHRTEIEDR